MPGGLCRVLLQDGLLLPRPRGFHGQGLRVRFQGVEFRFDDVSGGGLALSLSLSRSLSLSLSLSLAVKCNHPKNAPSAHDAFMNALMPNGIGSRLDRSA